MRVRSEENPSKVAAAEARREGASAAKAKSAVREYAEALGIAVLLALVIRTLVVQAFKIPSGSMLPTLQIGDHILVNKVVYGFQIPGIGGRWLQYSKPERGDIVVFVYPVDRSKDFIKRVIAVGGDTVEVRNKRVLVNGRPVDDPYAYFADGETGRTTTPRDDFGPVTVPAENIFVMGDNRDRSYDSRFWGFVDMTDVKGKAFIIYWSWDGGDRWVRWERLGDLIH